MYHQPWWLAKQSMVFKLNVTEVKKWNYQNTIYPKWRHFSTSKIQLSLKKIVHDTNTYSYMYIIQQISTFIFYHIPGTNLLQQLGWILSLCPLFPIHRNPLLFFQCRSLALRKTQGLLCVVSLSSHILVASLLWNKKAHFNI